MNDQVASHKEIRARQLLLEKEKFRAKTFFKPQSVSDTSTDAITKAEGLFTMFLVEHQLPLAAADHFSKLVKEMFPSMKVH